MAFSLGLSLARFHSVRFHGAKIQNKNAVCKFFGNYFPFFLQMLKSSLLRELRREGYGRDDGRDQGRDVIKRMPLHKGISSNPREG